MLLKGWKDHFISVHFCTSHRQTSVKCEVGRISLSFCCELFSQRASHKCDRLSYANYPLTIGE